VKLTLELSSQLEQRILSAAAAAGVPPDEYAVRVLDEKLSDAERRRQETIELLRSWRDEEDDEDLATYEELTQALDADRTSHRKLFPPELKGISW